jgi:hypothetical protein
MNDEPRTKNAERTIHRLHRLHRFWAQIELKSESRDQNAEVMEEGFGSRGIKGSIVHFRLQIVDCRLAR